MRRSVELTKPILQNLLTEYVKMIGIVKSTAPLTLATMIVEFGHNNSTLILEFFKWVMKETNGVIEAEPSQTMIHITFTEDADRTMFILRWS
jgi:hypothetical protein